MENRHKIPPVKWLMSFEAAARHMNFTKAAEELGLSQAAVSYQIKCLESMIGTPLFDRQPRNLQLTPAGQSYVKPISIAFEELLSSTASLFGPPNQSVVNVRVAISFMISSLAPALEEFSDAHPDIKINFWSSVWANAAQESDADIDIRFGDGNWDGFETSKLASDSAILVASPSIAERINSLDDLRPLNSNNFIAVTGYDDAYRHFHRLTGLQRVFDSVRVDTTIAAVEIAASTDRLAFVSKLLASPSLSKGTIKPVLDVEVPTTQAHYLLTSTTKRLSPEARTLKKWLLARSW